MPEYYPLSSLLEKLQLPKELAAIVGTKFRPLRRSQTIPSSDCNENKNRVLYRPSETVYRNIWAIVKECCPEALPPDLPRAIAPEDELDLKLRSPIEHPVTACEPLTIDRDEDDLELGVDDERTSFAWEDEAIEVNCHVADEIPHDNSMPPLMSDEPEPEPEPEPEESVPEFDMSMAMQLFESDNPFPVDFDRAWQWLGYARKDNAKKMLVSRFKEGRDYTLRFKAERVKGFNGGGSVTSERIHLTIECFKNMGMMAQTEQGDRVREYFLECERVAKEKRPSISRNPLTAQIQLLLQVQLEQEKQGVRVDEIEKTAAALAEENRRLKEQIHSLKIDQDVIEMETEANTVELQRYRNGHGRYYTIVAWCNLRGYKLSLQQCNTMGRKASAMCRVKAIQPQPINDPRFGIVNSYPDTVLEEIDWEVFKGGDRHAN